MCEALKFAKEKGTVKKFEPKKSRHFRERERERGREKRKKERKKRERS